jgi:short-subunit dehydrogenase
MSKQQIILITGATAGIGRHAALHLAARGHRIIASGRRENALASLRREAREAGHDVDTLRLDVTDADSIAAAVEIVARLTDGHGVDVLINNAGYGQAAPLVEVSDADLRKQFDTNVFGLMSVTRAFVSGMIDRGHGRIINVSSIGGRITFPMMGVYHASKYAVEALSDALRMELSPLGINVALIEPGPIRTEFIDNMHAAADSYKHAGSRYRAAFEQAELVETRAMSMAQGPATVSRAITRAVESRRPRARYVAPGYYALVLGFLRAMPTRVADFMMRSMFGLRPDALTAPVTAPVTAREPAVRRASSEAA